MGMIEYLLSSVMMKHATVALLLFAQPLLVGGSDVEDAAPAVLGLFVRRSWRYCDDKDESITCATRLAKGCTPSYTFEIESACYQVPKADFSGFRRSFRKFSVNDTHYCSNNVLFQSCAAAAAAAAAEANGGMESRTTTTTNCSYPYPLQGECPGDDPSRQEEFFHADFCIQSSKPVGDFVIPMIENRIYNDPATCDQDQQPPQDDNSVYVQTFLPSDPTLCIPNTAFVSTRRQLGSYTRTCHFLDGTSFTTVRRFTDPHCREQSPANQLPAVWTVNGCTVTDSLPGDAVSRQRQTADCASPVQYHCRDLTQLDYFTKVDEPVQDDDMGDGTDNLLIIDTPTYGLFVDQFWANWTGKPAERRRCEASSCVNRIQEGCIPAYRFLIQEACYQFVSTDFSRVRSERFFPLNTTHSCGRRSDGPACAGNESVACYPTPMGDSCPDHQQGGGNPSRSERFFYPNFCIQSTIPVGDFVVPFLDNQIYRDNTTCQAEGPIHQSRYLPSDPSLCLPNRIVLDDGSSVLGSIKRYCDADGNRVLERYTDPQCANLQNSATFDSICIASNLTGTLSSERYWEDCSRPPRYFCKDLTLLDFFPKVIAPRYPPAMMTPRSEASPSTLPPTEKEDAASAKPTLLPSSKPTGLRSRN